MLELIKNIKSTIWQKAQQALEKAITLYLIDPNVSLIDLGFRMRSSEGNRIEPELTVRVHVRQKLYGDEFKAFAERQPHRVINSQRIGFAVDFPQANYDLHGSYEPRCIRNDHDKFYQQICGGIGISGALGHKIGTLGGLVRDGKSGENMILSSWHVLVGSWSSREGLPIYQSAIRDDASQMDNIAEYTRGALLLNLDAALARLNRERVHSNKQLGIGAVTGITIPQLGMRVIKSGAGTGVTAGIITGILGYSTQHYDGINCVIGPIIHISSEKPENKICACGDSGAWWLEQSTLRAVGLHFAGSEDSRFGLALPMTDVLRTLNVEIVTEQVTDPLTNYSSIINTEKSEEVIHEHSTTDWKQRAFIFVSEIRHKYQLLIEKCVAFLKTININKAFRVPNVNIFSKQLLSLLRNRIIKFNWQMVQICFTILFCIIILSFNYYQPKVNRHLQQQLSNFQNTLMNLEAIAQIERERHNNVNKITLIIDRYNPDMAPELKSKIANEIYGMSIRYSNLDIELICATITHESAQTWDPQIVSPANAIGLMQIMPATGFYLAKEEGIEFHKIEDILIDPIINIRLGCRFLSLLIAAYNIDGGLAAYNGGMWRAELWLRNGKVKGILHKETDEYVPSILKIYKEYLKMTI